jgi:hypothetical protein
MNRIGRRTIYAMILIVVLPIICQFSPHCDGLAPRALAARGMKEAAN